MTSSRIRWRWVLPICQVILGAGLVYTATLEERTYRAQIQERAAAAIPKPGSLSFIPDTAGWGYVPISAQVVMAINFPVGVVFSPLFFIAAGSDSLVLGVGLAGVLAFWWWVGRWIDLRPKKLIHRRPPGLR
jgi:hypothetical protein